MQAAFCHLLGLIPRGIADQKRGSARPKSPIFGLSGGAGCRARLYIAALVRLGDLFRVLERGPRGPGLFYHMLIGPAFISRESAFFWGTGQRVGGKGRGGGRSGGRSAINGGSMTADAGARLL
jgi:hypothetical protein